MTKTFRPVIPSQLAVELNKAFASGEPHTICKAIGQALRHFNISELSKKLDCSVQTSIARSATNSFRIFQQFSVCSPPWACRSN